MPFWGKNTEDTIRIVKKGVLNVRQPSFKKLTAAAQNFVGSLIQQNPTKRATAAQAI